MERAVIGLGGRGGPGGMRRRYMWWRLAFIVVILVAVFAFHAHGSTLADLRIARIVVVVALLAGGGLLSRSRRGGRRP